MTQIPLMKTAKRKYEKNYVEKRETESGGVVRVYDAKHVKSRWKKKVNRLKRLNSDIKKLRKKYYEDLKSDDPKVSAVAAMVGLMDLTAMRVGNPDSADEFETFGASTLQKKHAKVNGGQIRFRFLGKANVQQDHTLTDSRLVKAIKKMLDGKKGKDLIFEYEEGKSVSAKVANRYLAEFDITNKDLRGFHANRIMKEMLKKHDWDEALELAAKEVGHEPKTLSGQYLDPAFVEKHKPAKEEKSKDKDKKAKKKSWFEVPMMKLANEVSSTPVNVQVSGALFHGWPPLEEIAKMNSEEIQKLKWPHHESQNFPDLQTAFEWARTQVGPGLTVYVMPSFLESGHPAGPYVTRMWKSKNGDDFVANPPAVFKSLERMEDATVVPYNEGFGKIVKASATFTKTAFQSTLKPSLPTSTAYTLTGADFDKPVYHAGKKPIKKLNPDKLGDRDSGWFGAGFYVALDPKYVKNYYGPVVSEFQVDPRARILVASVAADEAPEGLFEAVLAHDMSLPTSKKGDESYLRELLKKNQIEWVHAVDRFAETKKFDIVAFNDHEIVVKNLGMLGPVKKKRKKAEFEVPLAKYARWSLTDEQLKRRLALEAAVDQILGPTPSRAKARQVAPMVPNKAENPPARQSAEELLSELRPDFANNLRRLFNDYPEVKIVSGLRSIKRQRELHEDMLAGRRPGPVAPPGQSWHETGEAVDLNKFLSRSILRKYDLDAPVPHDPGHVQPVSGRRKSKGAD